MTTGTGFTTQLKEDTKQLAGDVATTAPIPSSVRAAGKVVKNIKKKMGAE